jgi:hypothetical protein
MKKDTFEQELDKLLQKYNYSAVAYRLGNINPYAVKKGIHSLSDSGAYVGLCDYDNRHGDRHELSKDTSNSLVKRD